MIQATYHFPRGFLWGTATAAHQVEGNNTNNQWWKWEQKGYTEGKSGLACDWWGGRWKEDLDRAAEIGQNAHRLSVEWSRIQPEPDRWDEDALDRYRTILRGMRERGITPMVTLQHFSHPLWLDELGHWENEATPVYFEKYVRKTVEALKEYAALWCTLNEPNGYAVNGYVGGIANFPPAKHDLRLAIQVMATFIRSHAAAYRTIHELQPEARVGLAMYYRSMVPHRSWSPLDQIVTKIAFNGINLPFVSAMATGVMRSSLGNVRIPEAKGTQDFFGFNYYTRDHVTFDLRRPKLLFTRNFYPEGADVSDTGFISNEPEGMYEGLKWITRTFPRLPIIVTENGVDDSTDNLRRRYMAQHIHQVWRAVNFNWPVRGYFHWTLVDNFEWERGWSQRFGLWALDPETQKRTRRPSADLYAEICRENGLSTEMVEKYCPEALSKIFPA